MFYEKKHFWKTYPHIDVISENPYNYCILRKKVFHQYLPRFLDPLESNKAKNYRLRFEAFQNYLLEPHKYWLFRPRYCNSTYRLRY